MKDKQIFFNPFRMISPKFDAEATRLEELYESPVSESFTLEEGLLVMLSKLMEMTRRIRVALVTDTPQELEICDRLANDVHAQEKILTSNLLCAITDPPDMCRTVVLFPGHLERIGDLLESIINCCHVKCRDGVPFSDKSVEEMDLLFKQMLSLMTNVRDSLIVPNRFLLTHTMSQADDLDRMCQNWQLSHVERLLEGAAAPHMSSLYLDILESTQSICRHIRQMAKALVKLLPED
jgi:Na+/phosphate symporter